MLRKLGAAPEALRAELDRHLRSQPRVQGAQLYVSPKLDSVLRQAQKEADQFKDDYVSTEHLLLALVSEDGTFSAKLLRSHGVDRASLLKVLASVRGTQRVTDPNAEEKYQALKRYARDLTELARRGKLDPVIGRDDEIRRLIQVLSRRTKNNPVLIGEPGVGKTAIVEGLAWRIEFQPESVPARLRDWEDVSAAPCNRGGDCLYIGDIGDNEMSRGTIQVFRIVEPDPGDRQTGRPQAISLTYPDGRHNAEAMFVVDERIFIVTKDRVGMLYRSAAAIGDVLSAFNPASTNIKLQRIAHLGLAGVTDAETSPDGATVAVRTADEVVMYATTDVMRGNVAARVRIPVEGLGEPQGEGVAVGENGMLYLSSEGRPLNRAGRLISLRCPTRLL